MGFSVACAMTGATLCNQDAVFIPLAPARFCPTGRNTPSVIGQSSFLAAPEHNHLFAPLTLPIFGRLDDGGGFERWEDDAHTALLRKRLKTDDLNAFFGAVLDGKTHPRITKMARWHARNHRGSEDRRQFVWDGKRLSGCWVAREAWDLFSSQTWETTGRPTWSVYDSGSLNKHNLEGMGFVCGPEDAAEAGRQLLDDKSHTFPWSHGTFAGLVVWGARASMSVRATYRDVTSAEMWTVAELHRQLLRWELPLPFDAERWVRSTSVLRSGLVGARGRWRRLAKSYRERYAKSLADPAMFFRILRDSTPPEVQSWQVRSRAPGAEALPRPTMPDSITQTLCDERFHATITGPNTDTPESILVEPCPCRGRFGPPKGVVPFKFDDEVWFALRYCGWKPPSRMRYDASDDAMVRAFAPEALLLYGPSLLDDSMLPRVEALLMFLANMTAANRVLTPTPRGRQFGHPHVEKLVGKMLVKLAGAQ